MRMLTALWYRLQFPETWYAMLMGLIAAGAWVLTGLCVNELFGFTVQEYERYGEGELILAVVVGFEALLASGVTGWFYHRLRRQDTLFPPTAYGSLILFIGAFFLLMLVGFVWMWASFTFDGIMI